jgi:uncharacterized protein YbaA (DUF1428 family)
MIRRIMEVRPEINMTYFSCYVAPIRKTDLESYRHTSREVGDLIRELGALEVHEFVGDDAASYPMTSFAAAVDCAEDETVIMGWSIWSSKADFDACNEQLARNPRTIMSEANFDPRRLMMANFLPLAA